MSAAAVVQNFCITMTSCLLQDLTPRAKDSLVSFGERMSTRIFASFLRVNGVPARQFDAPEIGFVTSDDFGNADILYDQTLSKVRDPAEGVVLSCLRFAGTVDHQEKRWSLLKSWSAL
jgi:aspartokinase